MEHENDILTVDPITEEETTFDYYEKPVETNNFIKKEYQKFSNYSYEKSPTTFEEYEVIQTYKPLKKEKKKDEFMEFVNEQNSYQKSNETFLYEKIKPKKQRKPINKIFVCISIFICVLMSTLTIVNSVNINKLNYSNMSKTSEIANVGKELVKIDQVIEGLVSEDNIKQSAEEDDFVVVTNTKQIDLIEKNEVKEYKGSTNLFDRICNFIISLFGG